MDTERISVKVSIDGRSFRRAFVDYDPEGADNFTIFRDSLENDENADEILLYWQGTFGYLITIFSECLYANSKNIRLFYGISDKHGDRIDVKSEREFRRMIVRSRGIPLKIYVTTKTAEKSPKIGEKSSASAPNASENRNISVPKMRKCFRKRQEPKGFKLPN